MLQLSCKFGELAQFLCWIIVLTRSTGMDHVINEYEYEK